MKLAKRSTIMPSLTLAMNAKAKEMKARGIDVISFAAGEPDFSTPAYIKDAGKKAIDQNKTYYTPDSGIPELKKAVADKLKRENNLTYSTEEIIINSGAKHSVFNVLSVLVDEGDEVCIPSPYWVSYSEMVLILGGRYALVPTTEATGFKIKPADLKKALNKKTKVLILNSPCNPTGAVYNREELFELGAFLEDKDIVILSDEVYEKIIYEGNDHVSIATYSDKIKSKTVVVNGVSKTFSMTGWRIGYAAGPKQIIEAMGKIQGHTSGNPTSISQYASLEALTGDSSFIRNWVAEFKKRKDCIVKELNSIEGVTCSDPQGAFYVFPNVSKMYKRVFHGYALKDSMDLANYLLEYGKIAVVPGKAFGADDYIRISFAASMENIIEGMSRLKNSLCAQ